MVKVGSDEVSYHRRFKPVWKMVIITDSFCGPAVIIRKKKTLTKLTGPARLPFSEPTAVLLSHTEARRRKVEIASDGRQQKKVEVAVAVHEARTVVHARI